VCPVRPHSRCAIRVDTRRPHRTKGELAHECRSGAGDICDRWDIGAPTRAQRRPVPLWFIRWKIASSSSRDARRACSAAVADLGSPARSRAKAASTNSSRSAPSIGRGREVVLTAGSRSQSPTPASPQAMAERGVNEWSARSLWTGARASGANAKPDVTLTTAGFACRRRCGTSSVVK
jgi:hypothetical protein